jgi:flagellar biosynthetic protein FliR
MVLHASLQWITAVLLCSVRLSALLLKSPVIDGFGVPRHIRALLVIALSACISSVVPVDHPIADLDAVGLIRAVASELATGALMGYSLHCAFATFSFAGSVLDQQFGFGIANVFDPVTHAQAPLIASLLGLGGILLFFGMDAHHALLRGLAWSLEAVPLGTGLTSVAVESLGRQFGLIYSLGLLFAAPMLFSLLLIELGMAVVSRNLPQMNIFMVSAPIKIVAGMGLLAVALPHMQPLTQRIFASAIQFWEGVR